MRIADRSVLLSAFHDRFVSVGVVAGVAVEVAVMVVVLMSDTSTDDLLHTQ